MQENTKGMTGQLGFSNRQLHLALCLASPKDESYFEDTASSLE